MFSETELLWLIGLLTAFIALLLVSRLPFFPRLVKLLGGPDPDYPKPPLAAGETILREGRVAFAKGLHGGVTGLMLLTNHRIIWYDDRAYILWPFKRISGEYDLREMASADKSSRLEHVFGGRRLRMRLRNGKDKCLWVSGLDDWIQAIRIAIAGGRSP